MKFLNNSAYVDRDLRAIILKAVHHSRREAERLQKTALIRTTLPFDGKTLHYDISKARRDIYGVSVEIPKKGGKFTTEWIGYSSTARFGEQHSLVLHMPALPQESDRRNIALTVLTAFLWNGGRATDRNMEIRIKATLIRSAEWANKMPLRMKSSRKD